MIKYKEIKQSQINNGEDLFKLRLLYPILLIYDIRNDNRYGNIYYTIPELKKDFNTYWFHKDNGPAVIELEDKLDNKFWFYYGVNAQNREQFYNLAWRKKIEIKIFL